MLVNPDSVTVENEHCSLPNHLVDNHQKHVFDAKPDFDYLAHAEHFDVTFCFPFVPALRFIYDIAFAFILSDEYVFSYNFSVKHAFAFFLCLRLSV